MNTTQEAHATLSHECVRVRLNRWTRACYEHAHKHLIGHRASAAKIALLAAVIFLIALFAAHLFGTQGPNFKAQLSAIGDSQTKWRKSRQAQASQQQSVDPFASRPRIQTQNGHLILRSSQDKNIEFRTSQGSSGRGSIMLNGLNLDSLLGVARAFERGSAASTNSSSDLSSSNQAQQVQYELLVSSLFSSVNKLRELSEFNERLKVRMQSLDKSVNKMNRMMSKRVVKQVNELTSRLDDMNVKLRENNCYDTLNGSGQPVCKNGATCLDLYDSFKCLCPKEWEGVTCEKDVNECAAFKNTDLGCQNGARCVNFDGGYKCECSASYRGIHCTERHDDCALASSTTMCGHGKCVNVARTQPGQAAYECVCDQGWTHDISSPACIRDINECAPGGELNEADNTTITGGGGGGSYPCSQNPLVECINTPGSFQCAACPAGYTGNGRVCRDIDECRTNNGGCSRSPLVECINTLGGRRCGACPAGFVSRDDGETCTRVPACQASQNGGCHPMARCIDLNGMDAWSSSGAASPAAAARLCVCQYPFAGTGVGVAGCELAPGNSARLPLDATSRNTSSVAELLQQQLMPAISQQGGGRSQNTPMSDCEPSPCLNEAACVLSEGGAECVCTAGWSGRLCDEPAAELACGGQLHTSRGVFEFPVSGTYDKLLANAPTLPDNPLNAAKCTWHLAVVSGAALRLDMKLGVLASPAGQTTRQQHVVQVNAPTLSTARQQQQQVAPAKCPATTSEMLEIRERLEQPIERAGTRGRLLARICVFKIRSEDSTATSAVHANHQNLTLVSESNLVDFEYTFTKKQQQAQTSNALTFQLNWTQVEPACGGGAGEHLPVSSSGSLSSPRFPDFYQAGSECRYLIRVPAGRRVRIQFGELTLLTPTQLLSNLTACADSLTILDGALGADRSILFQYCANRAISATSPSFVTPSEPIISSSSSVEVILVSRVDSSVPLMRAKQKRGFYLTYSSEDSIPGCGGLYTAKSALIQSIDFQTDNLETSSSSTDDRSAALELEFARYFDFKDHTSNYFATKLKSFSAAAAAKKSSTSTQQQTSSNATNQSSAASKIIQQNSQQSLKQQRVMMSNNNNAYKFRCEYEIRPADQARNHRVELEWLELPSELSTDSMSALSMWSRTMRCMRSRLLVFDGKPINYYNNDNTEQQQNDQQQLLATFCAGDRYNSSAPQLMPFASSGHVLYLVYESAIDPFTASTSSSNSAMSSGGNTWFASERSDGLLTRAIRRQQQQQQQQQGLAQKLPGGFRLRYSTVCSAVLRQLSGRLETELDADVDECVYHIVLPPNNTINVLVKPLVRSTSGFEERVAALTLPDGSCAAQAIFLDGAVPRGKLAIGRMERQLRTFEFSSTTSSSATNTNNNLNNNSYWQYASNQAHDIKEFDVCKLPSLRIDSVWNHMSLMFKLNPQLKSTSRTSSILGQNSAPTSGGVERLKFVVYYQAEPSCGGIVSEPRVGSFNLLTTSSNQKQQPLVGEKKPTRNSAMFMNQCAWILRNPVPNQLVQVNFTNIPVVEIKRRTSEWFEWARRVQSTKASGVGEGNNSSKAKLNSDSDTQLAIELYVQLFGEVNGADTAQQQQQQQQEQEQSVQYQEQFNVNLATNCSLAFQELIELYEPTVNRTRFLCPNQLVHMIESSSAAPWTSQSDTIYIRLINTTSMLLLPSSKYRLPNLKPLLNFSPIVSYKMLATRDDSCGGRLIQSSGVIQSPRFPFNYPPNTNCIWLIEAPDAPGSQLRLNFTHFNLEEQSTCWFDYLEIRNGPSESSPLVGRFCSRDLESRLVVSQSNYLWLKFRSDAHLSRSGFELYFDVAQTGCGGVLSAPSGAIASPNYPYAYAHTATCEWFIEVAHGNRIELMFEDLNLISSNSIERHVGQTTCPTSYLEVFDASRDAQAKSLGQFCTLEQVLARLNTGDKNTTLLNTTGNGNQLNKQVLMSSTSNRLSLVYRSDALDSGRGFKLSYTTSCVFERELVGFGGVIELPGFTVALDGATRSARVNSADPLDAQLCTWVLRAPLGSTVALAITELELDAQSSSSVRAPSTRAKQQQQASTCSSLDRVSVYAGVPLTSDLNALTTPLNSTRVNGAFARALRLRRRLKHTTAISNSVKLPLAQGTTAQTNLSLASIQANLTLVSSAYNFSLVRELCNSLDLLNSSERLFEIQSNLIIVSSSVHLTPFDQRPRRMRIEWRAHGCGGQQVIAAAGGGGGVDMQRPIEGIRFDERLNLSLTSRNNNNNKWPLECLWSIDASRVGRALEFDLSSDMRSPAVTQQVYKNSTSASDACTQNSLTIYDGLSYSSPVVTHNCDSVRSHELLLASSGQLLVRLFLASVSTMLGRNFALNGWLSNRDECSHSVYDLQTPLLQVAGTRTSPKWPDLYEARSYSCHSLLTSAASSRLRFVIEELDIPTTSTGDDDDSTLSSRSDTPTGLLDAETCRKSGNYLELRSATRGALSDAFCGKYKYNDKSDDNTNKRQRATFILEQQASWLEFFSKGTTRGKWKLSYTRLCGSLVAPINFAEEFATPNYPARPEWPAEETTSSSEHVCIWRLASQSQSDWAAAADVAVDAIAQEEQQVAAAELKRVKKLHFILVDFVESDAKPRDVAFAQANVECLRVYEGAEISLRQSSFNFTELDAKYTPVLRICSRADLKYSTLYYVSRGTELTVLTSGRLIVKFRVKPYENYCGGEFVHQQAEFASPNYPQPYETDLDCHYFVFGPAGSRINLQFQAFELSSSNAVGEQKLLTNNNNDEDKDSSSSSSCDSADYVEVRQLSASKRVELKLKAQAANADDLANLFKTHQNNSSSTTSGGRIQALERLAELARIYRLFGDSIGPASSNHMLANRVLGQNKRLAIRLEDYYASSTLIGRFCGSSVPANLFGPNNAAHLLRDELLVRFRSHSNQPDVSSRRNASPKGFLAQYKIEPGGKLIVTPSSDQPSGGWNFLSSTLFPELYRSNSTISWQLETRANHVLEFELISLQLGALHRACTDTLVVYDDSRGKYSNAPLARFCGLVSFKKLLDKSMESLWTSALLGRVSARKLVVNAAHEPLVQANLLRRIRTSSNVASVVYDNKLTPGAFLMRYRAISVTTSASLNNTNLDDELLNAPLELDESLDEQFGGGLASMQNSSTSSSAVDKSCSRMYKLSLLPTSGGFGARSSLTRNSQSQTTTQTNNDSIVLMSPGWPSEVRDTAVECEWLVTTHDNTNIRFSVDLQTSTYGSSLGAGEQDEQYSQYGATSSLQHSDTAACPIGRRGRNFVTVYDGASRLAPLLARLCLPARPIQLQSSGKHLLVRYVHATPTVNELDANAQTNNIQSRAPSSSSSSLFKATASVGHCGGQYHVLYSLRLRDRIAIDQQQQQQLYENNLDCVYHIFASSASQVLNVQAIEFDLAREPTNADCSVGDWVELRDLPVNVQTSGDADDMSGEPEAIVSPAAAAQGRLLGRFCAGRPLKSGVAIETPGSAISVRFRTDSANTGAGFELMLVSTAPYLSCPRSTLALNADEPHARLLSPGWPHGFSGKRKCKYSLLSPRNYSLEVTFVRLRRPLSSSSSAANNCSDSFVYLDDQEAFSLRYDQRPLRELRGPLSGPLLQQLVRNVPCRRDAPLPVRAQARELLAPSATPVQSDGSGPLGLSKLTPDEYKQLLLSAPANALVLRTTSDSLLLEYESSSGLLPDEGFVALVRAVQQAPGSVCGGDVYARTGANALESARFGVQMSESDEFVQCSWRLKFDPSATFNDYDGSGSGGGWTNANWDTLDAMPSKQATGQQVQLVGALFKTSFLLFDVLEIAPAGEGVPANASAFAHLSGGYGLASDTRDTCGLRRLLVVDAGNYRALSTCGLIASGREPIVKQQALGADRRWMLVSDLTASEVMVRTKNLRLPVWARWHETNIDGQNSVSELEKREHLFRGMRAYFYESTCAGAEKLIGGDALRIRSHSQYKGSGNNNNQSTQQFTSYAPGICRWTIKLKPGQYEVSLRSINLRPREASTNPLYATTLSNTTTCDIHRQDYIELRMSGDAPSSVDNDDDDNIDSPLLARYCSSNQREAQKHALPLNATVDLSITFVAGLARLLDGRETFDDDGQQVLMTNNYGFELQVTRVRSLNVSSFCRRDSTFNIFSMIRNKERSMYYGAEYYASSLDSQGALYPKNTHCQVDMSIDSEFRFNLTFVNIFDMEPATGNECKNDYIEINDLIEQQELQTTTTLRTTKSATKQRMPTTRTPQVKRTTTSSSTVVVATTSGNNNSNSTTTSNVKQPWRIFEQYKLNLQSNLIPKRLGRWCGRKLPSGYFLSKSNKIRIVFHSNERIEGKGFVLQWSATSGIE